jgi:hypothetical protein
VAGHNEHLRCALRAAACLCLALCAVGGWSVAADEIHYFRDERGVAHFSNVPADPRYRPYLRATAEAGINATTDRPSVILFAPPLVAPGSEFAANVVLAAPADVYGWVDIAFDPAALTLGAVSVEHELPSANIVRLKVDGGPSADFSAELHFRANASRISSTNIGLGEAALKTSSSGKPVVARKPPAASIAFLSLGQ